jgi:hypothetical protein
MKFSAIIDEKNKRSSINDVTVLEVRGYQGFYDSRTKAFVPKSVNGGREGLSLSKIFQNCVTSFMNDP